MNDARWYAVWPEPRSRSRSLKGSRPSVPTGLIFLHVFTVYRLLLQFLFALLYSAICSCVLVVLVKLSVIAK